MNESKEDLNERLGKLKKLEEVKKLREKKEIITRKLKESLDEILFVELKKKHKIIKPIKPKPIFTQKKKTNKSSYRKYCKLKEIIREVFVVYETLNTEGLTNVIKNIYLLKYARTTISEVCTILVCEGYLIRTQEKYAGRGRPKVLWKRGNKIIIKNKSDK